MSSIDASLDSNNVIQNNFNSSKMNSNPLPNPINIQKNFLTLLLAQIKNQDPTDPIKNTELTSQLTQINMASGINQLNDLVEEIGNQLNINQQFQFNSLIGRHVMIPNHEILYNKEITPTKFGAELHEPATSIEVQISDKQKNVLYTKKIQKLYKPGIYNFSWDGKNINNTIVESGKYDITITAQNKDKSVPITSLSSSLVHSIIISPDSNDLIIDLGPEGKTTLFNIREIL